MQLAVEDWLEKTLLPYVQSSHPRALGNENEASSKIEALPSYARSKKSETHSKHATISALEEMQFDRDSLANYGLDKTAQDKVYRSYYVHCHGIHEIIRTYQGIHPDMATRMWEVFVAIFQYYDPELRQTFLNYLKENQDQKTVRVIERLTVHVEELTAENEKLKNENVKLKVARTSADYEQELSHQVDKRLIESLQEKVDFYQHELHLKEKYIENLCTTLEERRETSKLSETLLIELSMQHKVILEEIIALRKTRKDLEKEKNSLKSKCMTLDKTINVLRDELSTTKDDLRQETRAHISLQDQHSKLEQDHEILKEKWAKIQIDLRDSQFLERTTHDTLLEMIKLFNSTIPELQQFLIASDQLEGISKTTKSTLSKLSDQIDVPGEFKYVSFKTRLPDKLKCMTLQDFVVEPPPPRFKVIRKRKNHLNASPEEEILVPDNMHDNNVAADSNLQVADQSINNDDANNLQNVEGVQPTCASETSGTQEYKEENDEDEWEEEIVQEEDEPIDPDAELKNRKKFLYELVESGRSWSRYFMTLQKEYFSLFQQPTLRQVLEVLCRKSEELIEEQQKVKALKTKIVCHETWPPILCSVLGNQRFQVIRAAEEYDRLMEEKLGKEMIIETLEATIVELTEFKNKYIQLEPKFLQLVDIYKQSVRDKKEVDTLLQEAKERITMFERMEVDFKNTRHLLDETKIKLEEKEAYVEYLRNEQKKIAGKTGVDRRRTLKRAPSGKDRRGSMLEQLRRSFTTSTNNFNLNGSLLEPSSSSGKRDPISVARENAVLAAMSSDVVDGFVANDRSTLNTNFQSPPSSPRKSTVATSSRPSDNGAPLLTSLLKMDSTRLRGLSSARASMDLSSMSIDENADQKFSVDANGRKIDDKEFDDLETVIADVSDALLASLLAISEMVQMSVEMQENDKRIHEQHHGSGNLTPEGTLLMQCVEKVEKALESLKDHRDNILYDVSYNLYPSMKAELLTVFESMLQMPQHMVQLMHYADEIFDLRTEKEALSGEIEKVKLFSARDRARMIKQYDEQIYDLKQTIAQLQQ